MAIRNNKVCCFLEIYLPITPGSPSEWQAELKENSDAVMPELVTESIGFDKNYLNYVQIINLFFFREGGSDNFLAHGFDLHESPILRNVTARKLNEKLPLRFLRLLCEAHYVI
ncbi:unnamed protein product [Clavelina lepadiformis]|uniref:Uncharacterized protein n=1 Tax=Clavelina lepadiformis TaxID=159417 RepID=A0ABP0FPP2_CLALP